MATASATRHNRGDDSSGFDSAIVPASTMAHPGSPTRPKPTVTRCRRRVGGIGPAGPGGTDCARVLGAGNELRALTLVSWQVRCSRDRPPRGFVLAGWVARCLLTALASLLELLDRPAEAADAARRGCRTNSGSEHCRPPGRPRLPPAQRPAAVQPDPEPSGLRPSPRSASRSGRGSGPRPRPCSSRSRTITPTTPPPPGSGRS